MGHICIPGIGLELACSEADARESFQMQTRRSKIVSRSTDPGFRVFQKKSYEEGNYT